MAFRFRFVALRVFLCVLMGAAFGAWLHAQVSTQTTTIIEGIVVDNIGVVPGATVTLTSVPSGLVASTTTTNENGQFRFTRVAAGRYTVRVEIGGFKPLSLPAFVVGVDPVNLGTLTIAAGGISESVTITADVHGVQTATSALTRNVTGDTLNPYAQWSSGRGLSINGGNVPFADTEVYARVETNPFKLATVDAVSTFAADVDTASYANVRRFLREHRLPPVDAVRIEELINYFRFLYPEPADGRPVSITTEVGPCPWAPGHQLALVGLRAKAIDDRSARGRNIVLLLDVSGSMTPSDRLPLIKTAMRMFVDTLRDEDRLAIVVYAGASGLALPSTRGSERTRIHDALESLQAGGSTNGAAGITLAYRIAREQFIPGGINRVILATDGDFNVGVTSQGDLLDLIQRQRDSGVFLSVLGVGRGNLKDSTMEMLADKGNGEYAYLDSLQEARRVLVAEGGSTLETVAKDVKFQVEFNPARVAAWKLIGYENRVLAKEDFNDDRKDGGEIGAGHTVTALYELVPAGSPLPDELQTVSGKPLVDPLTYQTGSARLTDSPDLFTVKIRYKLPEADSSTLMTRAVRPGGPAPNLSFAAAVADFGRLLRDRSTDPARWDAFERRVSALEVAVNPVDHNDFATLVALAVDLQRQR